MIIIKGVEIEIEYGLYLEVNGNKVTVRHRRANPGVIQPDSQAPAEDAIRRNPYPLAERITRDVKVIPFPSNPTTNFPPENS